MGISEMNIRKSKSPVDIYIQHPIPIPAPGDKNKIEMKPLKLTKKVSWILLGYSELPLMTFIVTGAKEDEETAETG